MRGVYRYGYLGDRYVEVAKAAILYLIIKEEKK